MADYSNITALDPEAIELLDNKDSDTDTDIDDTNSEVDTTEDGVIEDDKDVDEPEDTGNGSPSKFEIDGIGEVTPEEIKEWKNGYLRQSDYTKKTTELARQREETKDALEVFNFLKNNPQIVQGLKQNGDTKTAEVVSKTSIESEMLRELMMNQRKMEIEMQLSRLHSQYGDFDEVEILNTAADLGTGDLETVLRAKKFDSKPEQNIEEILSKAKAEWLKELEENKSKLSTIVTPKSNTQPKTVSLTASEKRVADAMGMSYAEYAKWK